MDLNTIKSESDIFVTSEIDIKTEPPDNSCEFLTKASAFTETAQQDEIKTELLDPNIKLECLDIKNEVACDPLDLGYRSRDDISFKKQNYRKSIESDNFLTVVDKKSYEVHKYDDLSSQSQPSPEDKTNNDVYNEKKNFSCNLCKKVFSREDNVTAHIRFVHSDVGHALTQSSAEFAAEEGKAYVKEEHLFTVFNKESYNNDESCNQFQLSESSVHKKNIQNDTKRFNCDLCGKMFSRKDSVSAHLRYVHSGVRPFTCDICQKSFSLKCNLNKHLRNHFVDKLMPKCNTCQKTFTHKVALFQHLKNHLCIDPDHPSGFNCNECGKSFNFKSHLEAHLRSHTGVKPFICRICKKTFSHKSNLTAHMKIHFGDKSHTCDTCSKEFIKKSDLDRHKLIHSGDKPYECDQCNLRFRQKGDLALHKRTHSGEKPYECDVCRKAFTIKSNLTIHRRIHTGERFSCNICNKSYTRKETLIQHKQIHNN